MYYRGSAHLELQGQGQDSLCAGSGPGALGWGTGREKSGREVSLPRRRGGAESSSGDKRTGAGGMFSSQKSGNPGLSTASTIEM